MIKFNNNSFSSVYDEATSIGKIMKGTLKVFESWRDLIASGVPPLTLTNCKGVDLIDYKIEGNSRQGTLLPIEYQQLDYIESTGTQYIEIDYIASGNTVSKGTYQLTNIDVASMLFGSRTNASSNGYALNWSSSKPSTYINTYGAGGTSGPTNKTIDTLKHTFEKIDGDLYIDGELISERPKLNFNTPSNMIVFGGATAGQINHKCQAKIYSLQFYDEDVLKIDLVPCYRKEDNVAGMYDLVNNVFYTNQGEGEFIKGSGIVKPDNPVEIESVGDKTKNLFTPEKISISSNAANFTIVDNGFSFEKKAGVNTSVSVSYDIYLKAGTYTISGSAISSDGSDKIGIAVRFGSTFIVNNSSAGSRRGVNFSFTVTENETYRIGFYCDYASASGTVTTFKNIQIEEGSVATEYEPYGYRIPIKVSGKNIFDADTILPSLRNPQFPTAYWVKQSDGSFYLFNVGTLQNYNWFENTEGYTGQMAISITGRSPNAEEGKIVFGVRIYYTDDTYNTIWIYYSEEFETKTLVSNANKTISRICQVYSQPKGVYIKDIMIAYGNDAEYEPYMEQTTNIYLNEPLRKVGDFADYIDFENKKVVRKIIEKRIEKINSLQSINSNGIANFQFVSDNYKFDKYSLCLCNRFKPSINVIGSETEQTIYIYAGQSRASYLRIKSEIASTVNEMNEWLKNNETIYSYPLQEPKEEEIELPNIPTNKGTSILSINTIIQPSNLEVVYKGKEVK